MPEQISSVDNLYNKFKSEFLESLNADEFFAFFMNAIQSGRSNISLYEKYIDRTIDLKWVEAIETAILPLDTIIRNPNRFIKNEEEIVPIEMARQVSTESIRHLAMHTNMIAKVEGDQVTPQRILNVIKEESFETYENRFIYTLLLKLEYFIDKRLQELLKGINTDDEFELKLNGECNVGHDKLTYDVNISYVTPHLELSMDEMMLQSDTSKMSSMQRLERIRKILYNFKESPLIKSLAGCAIVRPPLNMTNVLTKNQNFIKAVDLWVFLDTYEGTGYTMDFVERETVPEQNFIKELFSTVAFQYTALKTNTGHSGDVGDYDRRQNEVAPNVVRRDVDNLIDNYELEIDEVRRVFIERVEKKKKIKRARYAQIREIIDRAITFEQENLEAEEKLLREKAERERKAKEEERRKREQKLLREKELIRIAKEKAKVKAEKEKQKKQLEKEKQKAKLQKQKDREKAQAKAQKDKERAAKQKAAEKLAKEKALEKEKIKARKEKALAREMKQKALAKEAREKAKLKEKERYEKEKAKVKAAEKLRRQREKEKTAKMIAKEKEVEKLRRQREKLKLQKIKEAEKKDK